MLLEHCCNSREILTALNAKHWKWDAGQLSALSFLSFFLVDLSLPETFPRATGIKEKKAEEKKKKTRLASFLSLARSLVRKRELYRRAYGTAGRQQRAQPTAFHSGLDSKGLLPPKCIAQFGACVGTLGWRFYFSPESSIGARQSGNYSLRNTHRRFRFARDQQLYFLHLPNEDAKSRYI